MFPRICCLLVLQCIFLNVYPQSVLRLTHAGSPLSVVLSAENGALNWSVTTGHKTLIAPSAAGFQLNNASFGRAVEQMEILRRGGSEYTVAVKDRQGAFNMEFRLSKDGCAFRYILPAGGQLMKELTAFGMPAESRVWFFERTNAWKLKSYAGWWTHTTVDSLPVISPTGPVQGKPLVLQLPGRTYMAITEAGLYNYSGMRLEATGNRTVQVNFTEGDAGFHVDAGQPTPWRVIMYATDLNTLVNNGMITALNPRPDASLYRDVSYIRPGKAVWSWITRKENYMQPAQEKRFIDAAAALKFDYTLLDEGWETIWPNKWEQLTDICRYAAERKVKVWVWRDSKLLRNPQQRDLFLDSLVECGVAGIKTDFMNSEARELVDFEIDFLKATAARRLMVNFHGCHAPTGESVTYPNEMTREGIRGLELNPMNEPIPAWHNAALPFTRFLCGHGDYTPGFFTNKGPTTYAHQLALMYLFNSLFQCMAENPVTILNDPLYAPIIPLLQTLPVTWDETRVLEGSEIGELAALAKRSGKAWYVAVINGTDQPREFTLRPDFLPRGRHRALVVRDGNGFVLEEQTIQRQDVVRFTLPATGGLVIRISR